MATTNHERVGKALELLREGLQPFVEREMRAAYDSQWLKQAGYSHQENLRGGDDPALSDAHALLVIMWDHWNEAFNDTLGFSERSLVSELRDWRNKWAYQQLFSGDDAYRALAGMARPQSHPHPGADRATLAGQHAAARP